jgi:Protein of unknown function (DUF2752)
MHALWVLAAALLVLGGVRLIPHLPIPLPACGLRTLTGIPCPLCGGTRCLMAWSHLEITQAFRFNPLVATGCLAVGFWLFLSLLDAWSGRNWAGSVTARLQHKPWPGILAAAAVVNWIYLVFCLPK